MKPQYEARDAASSGGDDAGPVTASATRIRRPAFAARCNSVRSVPTGNVSPGVQFRVTRTAPTPRLE